MRNKPVPSTLIIRHLKDLVSLRRTYRYSFDIALREMPVEDYLELVKVAEEILEVSKKTKEL